MKFKVGDRVKDEQGHSFKIVKIAEAGEEVKGPWSFGNSLTIGQKSYILEDEEGVWCYDPVRNENELELLQDQKPVQTPQQDLSSPFPTLKEFLGV